MLTLTYIPSHSLALPRTPLHSLTLTYIPSHSLALPYTPSLAYYMAIIHLNMYLLRKKNF